MILKKFSSKYVLKELCLRNLSGIHYRNYLSSKFNIKVFFPINNYKSLDFFGESFLFFSLFFYSFLLNNFNLKFSFSKKVFIKRRKKQITRQLQGFYIFLSNSFISFFYLFEFFIYFFSPFFYFFFPYKEGVFNRHSNILCSNVKNLNFVLSVSFFFEYFFNYLFRFFILSDNIFFSFFFFKGFNELSFFFFFYDL